ncbi:hypothetical protein SZ47_06425 [Brachyspira hyodysenteriae]|uniref:Uncharacterized protein n=1 Tax=Brachyspira hyodysenteriae ATCC 27164 TaxID=1266923 RepID=A0A3B6W298_BRAHO|nr:hypothetical protein BHYOB78_09120 [Brachyspira hyodysenteriae ATCC 27164]KLI14463.1 hypothetical protein SU44_11720 [Brachyspira hyodysenteriae]KLI17769.1 hypothetical protein SU45_04300 [Brachyspira hyodysenteriae]KLI19376.1 hypothetical protein SU46_07280 [Brachyspira hyodysenteriae]KLI24656.1 hypothetical protein SU43_04485 [Brachyspira hyodysenteriae]
MQAVYSIIQISAFNFLNSINLQNVFFQNLRSNLFNNSKVNKNYIYNNVLYLYGIIVLFIEVFK